MVVYFRGGPTLVPRLIDVIIDPKTGLLSPKRGVSIFDHSNGLERFGGAYEVGEIPESLTVIQRGLDPHHFEIVPLYPMTLDEYEAELAKIPLKSV